MDGSRTRFVESNCLFSLATMLLTLTRQPDCLTAYARVVDLHGLALFVHLLIGGYFW